MYSSIDARLCSAHLAAVLRSGKRGILDSMLGVSTRPAGPPAEAWWSGRRLSHMFTMEEEAEDEEQREMDHIYGGPIVLLSAALVRICPSTLQAQLHAPWTLDPIL
eukprot:2256061-Pyramimonas_sp.AAC.1